MEPSPEGELIRQAQNGDVNAFEQLLYLHEKRLLGQAAALCRDESTGMDLAQETLIEAWRSIARFNHTCKFSTWLYAILLNRCRKMKRRETSRPSLTLIESEQEQRPSLGQTPAETVQTLDKAEAIKTWVAALPEAQREVVQLRFFADAELKEIANTLDCSLGTVKSRLFYGLQTLRKKIKNHEPLDGGKG